MTSNDPSLARIDGPRETLDGRWEVRGLFPGAMGTVLILEDPATGARFAAKTPRVEHGLSDDTIRRFEAEARTWLSLGHHENVVEAVFYETIRWRGVERPFLFLEYVDGPTLDALLRTEGRFAVPAALDVLTGMAWGMSHAHGDGRAGARIVHRDLKPDNAFLTRNRVVKVSDFGIARALDRPEEHQGDGFGLGTPYYASPEQMRDARRADVRSDVYSFGAVAYQLLVGEPPFPATDLSALVWKVLREAPPPIRPRVPQVPEPLERLIMDCLAKEPSARPASFADVLERVSGIREFDDLWLPPPGARSCEACGWLSLSTAPSCGLCGKRTGRAARYAPVSRRSDLASPTMGRAGLPARLEIEGTQIRPRSPRAGEEVVVTVLLGNTGAAAAQHVSLPYVRPSRDAFAFVEASGRRGFRGTIPPTAAGAPIRISWTLRPLREGRFRLRAPRVTWRDADGRRQAVRGDDIEIVVAANDAVPFVGRDEEMKRLVGLLDGAEAGLGAKALLIGLPGTGKSRLARAVLDLAAARGFAAVRGRCLDRGVEVRGALKDALRQLLDLRKTGAAAPEVAAALVQMLGDTGRAEPRLLSFLVDELVGRPLSPGENARHLWARFAAAVSRTKPLAIVLEDVQRDPEVGWIAAEMADAAGRDHGRFLAILTARGEIEDEQQGSLVRRIEDDAAAGRPADVVRLSVLGQSEVAALLDSAFRPNDFATSATWLAGELQSITGGNPLYLSELLKTIRAHSMDEHAVLVTRDGSWTAGPGLTPERMRDLVPPRIEQVVVERLHQLPPDVRAFAYAASVLGDAFEIDVLRTLLGASATFEASLARLEEEGLLREIAGGKIRFREPLLPEVLHRDLRANDPLEHARLHGEAADLLGALPGAKDRNALRLSRHLMHAGRPDRAFPAILDAARRLLGRQAYRRAAAVLDEAKNCLDSGMRAKRADRLDYLTLRGEALRFTGDYRGALEAWRTVVAEAGDGRGDADRLGTLYSSLGKVHEAIGQFDDALYCYAVGLSLRRDQGQAYEVPLSLTNLAGLHLVRGESDRAAAYLDEAVESARQVGNHLALGRAFVLRARILVQRGETRAARGVLRQGLSEARAARDDVGGADAWVVVGLANYREGRNERALVHFRRALRIRQTAGDLAGIAVSYSTIAAIHEATGDLASALAEFERSADVARRIRSMRALGVALTNLGRVQLALGQPKKAKATLEEAISAGTNLGDAPFIAAALADLARACRWLGDVRGCADRLSQAVRIARASGDHDVQSYVAARECEHLLAAGMKSEALGAVRVAVDVQGQSPQVRVDTLSLVAELADGAEADAAAAEAGAVASQSPSPYVRARALAARARVDLRAGARERAVATFRQSAGLLLSSDRLTPFVAQVLLDAAEALHASDPEAATAARRRAREILRELLARGFSDAAGTGFPSEPAAR
ncbi:MAG: protein kinase [Planctomycetes bacterium]|nr:protein kinase [Planctomycetota bacterium]